MTNLLNQLQQASKALNTAVEPEACLGLLLAELRRLCRADLVLLFQPDTPRHWRLVEAWPAELTLPLAPPIEIVWGETDSGPRQRTALEQILQQRQGLCCHDPIRAGEFNFSYLRVIEIGLERQIISSLLLPLAGPKGRAERVIELHRLEPGLFPQGFSADELAAALILTQQAESSLLRMNVRREMTDLFEALIQLIGSTIDEKSPYSGDHCRRVPVIALSLARAVSRSQVSVFKSVKFTFAELYELEVAAWLHDIGKLVTPIQITDKATKLERIIDRFDLVRTRFEIVQRDLEIARLRANRTGAEVKQAAPSQEAARMIDDLRFLADCNRGRSSLSAEETRRVHEIAEKYRWMDRQGEEMSVLTDDEVANLTVLRGTITDAEREMINQHVVSTINMLDMLPFPEELARVPEIAASHHEYPNGQGFPSGLRSEQMLIQSRILGFADLFESVSSGSRSYKKSNSLNQALWILREMVDAGQADRDLFCLFVAEKLFAEYAAEFLSRDQIDQVNCAALLAGL
jgi:HD-GYP domain-containing protein (c-di-GMP phosphodiesterase class II)